MAEGAWEALGEWGKLGILRKERYIIGTTLLGKGVRSAQALGKLRTDQEADVVIFTYSLIFNVHLNDNINLNQFRFGLGDICRS